ncbi:class I SAM-dependent methyltransferase [Pseudopedobacter beijingensis]|uniref:S-adenosyl-L-methionine-dependent methyltransferase n=1 Tax=Pseudopedobacter beijingensis TaxID=1207056 RepID=A0ABW4IDM7_9SPHI
MQAKHHPQPNQTAVRTALWRALHLQADPLPHILEDAIGIKLVSPEKDWEKQPDMDPDFTRRVRLAIVTRARFMDDLATTHFRAGINQYIILGSGLDTFAQRRSQQLDGLQIFEIDHPDTLTWKEQRLKELGYTIPPSLHFVPVNFEEQKSWLKALEKSGFDSTQPAFIACTGVSMYLTQEAILDTLKQISRLASGSKLVMTFMLPFNLISKTDQPLQQISIDGAKKSGTPFISFFSPEEAIDLANSCHLKEIQIATYEDLENIYFIDRSDNLSPADGEIFLMADIG